MSGNRRHNETRERAARLIKAGAGAKWLERLQATITGAGPRAFIHFLESRIAVGRLVLMTPDGAVHRICGAAGGPEAAIEVRNWRAARRLIAGGGVGFARAYIEGHWDSPDLAGLIELATLNRQALGDTLRGSGLARALNRLRHLLRTNHRLGAKRNIEFHYDLGNAFYREWLDPSMTYSSAVFEAGDNSLEAAQMRKYRRLLDLLDVQPGQHILEIGCGWGGFAETAARERGARVTGITLSHEQLAYARGRIAKAGLGDKVEFRLVDYRDVSGRFDHVASIEMFEAVGEKYWPSFFGKIHEVLAPGGRAAIQFITIEDAVFEAYRRSADFIQTYIFPGGMLPTKSLFKDLAGKARLTWAAESAFGQHYARTLAAWRAAFNTAFDEGRLPEGFDDAFRRLWNYYLAYCEGGFRAGGIDVMQVALARE